MEPSGAEGLVAVRVAFGEDQSFGLDPPRPLIGRHRPPAAQLLPQHLHVVQLLVGQPRRELELVALVALVNRLAEAAVHLPRPPVGIHVARLRGLGRDDLGCGHDVAGPSRVAQPLGIGVVLAPVGSLLGLVGGGLHRLDARHLLGDARDAPCFRQVAFFLGPNGRQRLVASDNSVGDGVRLAGRVGHRLRGGLHPVGGLANDAARLRRGGGRLRSDQRGPLRERRRNLSLRWRQQFRAGRQGWRGGLQQLGSRRQGWRGHGAHLTGCPVASSTQAFPRSTMVRPSGICARAPSVTGCPAGGMGG